MSVDTKTAATMGCMVYGSLKSGYWNHEAYCQEALSIEEAIVRGLLYELPTGIPVLEVPPKDIIAVGSADILADLALQRRLESEPVRHPNCDGDSWDWIEGELVTLPDPVRTMPPIDRLEGFRPRGESFYRRVLVPVILAGKRVTTAWCYVAGPGVAGMLAPTGLNRWRSSLPLQAR